VADVYLNKIFRGSRAIAKGRLTPGELRSRAWQRLFRDVYADARLERTHRLMCQTVNAFLLPEGAALAGRSAAHLHGVPYVSGKDPVEIISPRPLRMKGIAVHSGRLAADEWTKRDGLTVTTPVRTCWDLARWLDAEEAVVFVDALARRGVVTRETLSSYASHAALIRGHGRFLKVIELMDAGAESPQESRLRVRLVLAGLPAPASQVVIRRDNMFVARADLAWSAEKVAVEYDGVRWHTGQEQLGRDRRRLNRVLGADWLVFHVTADQMRHGLDELVAELRSALRKRARSADAAVSHK
jgi:very-short-patch-repair endonuclease